MAREFKENSHLKVDKKKYEENFDQIKWAPIEDKPKKKTKKRHITAGMCGEYGMSEFDDEKYKENFDRIDWNKKKE